MNKLCFRVVFNRTRQMLTVVSELARACGGATGDKETTSLVPSSRCLKLSSLSWAILLAAGLVTQTASAAAAGIVVDKSAASNQQATVISNRNGPTQVNIQTPNSNGLSHNKYTQFDVNSQGVVLNNSSKSTRSELAGRVAANSSLAKGEAKVILNEVNSRNPSQLRGYIEVAGKKADVIIANPAGITCDGCGFINAGRATLAAGQAQVNNGTLSGFDVDNGRIQINDYLDGTRTDYTTLIARSVAVNNSVVYANDLSITTGRNQTDAQGNVISTSADSATGKLAYALDVAEIGGMYAGKITMTGTERGVGVRNAGEIGALVGELALSIDGKLSNQGLLYSENNLALKGGDIDNRGQLGAFGKVSVNASGQFLNNEGYFYAGDDATITAAQISNRNGEIHAERALSISTSQLNNQGEINGQSTRIHAEQLVNTGGITGYENHITATSLTNTGTGGIYGDNLTIDARTLVNNADENGNSGTIYGLSSVKIATDNLTNRDGAQIYSEGDMAIGKTLSANGTVSGMAQKVENLSADIVAMGSLDISAQRIENRDLYLQLGDKMDEVYYSPGKNEWQYCDDNSNGSCTGGDGKRYTFGPWMNGRRYALDENGSHIYGIYLELESVKGGGNRLSFHIPEQGVNTTNIYEYQYQTRIYETEVLNSATAMIGSGKEMRITANNLLNEDSQILAVEDLVMQVNNLENREQKRTRRTEEVGNTTSYYTGSDGKTHQELRPYEGKVKVEEVSNSLITGNFNPTNS